MHRDKIIAVAITGIMIALGPLACGGNDDPPSEDEGNEDDNSDSEDSDGGTEGTDTDSTANFDVEIMLASDIDPDAPGTVGIVTWSMDRDDITDAFLEFGLDADYGMVAPVDLEEPGFRTLLLGMKPNQTYHLRVIATAGGVEYVSDDYTVETGEPTNLVNISEFNVANDSVRERGFILTSNWERQGGGFGSAAFVIDPDGEIVWWHQSSIGALSAARMSADGQNVWMVTAAFEGGSIERVTMDTLDGQLYEGLGSPSHDIIPVEGDIMAFLDYGGMPNHAIVEIDPDGNVTVVSTLEGAVIDHSNTLRYYPEEDLYIYSDWQQDVFAVNRSDGSIAWRLSELTDADWGPTQHGTHLLEDSLVIFANNGSTSNTAAVLEFSRDDGSIVFSYNSGFTVTNLGDVQRLPGGNTLVTCSTAGRILEIDANANLIMSMRSGPFGYANWRESLYGPPQRP